MSYIKLAFVLMMAPFFVGCAHYPSYNPYQQPSPVIKTMRESGNTMAHKPARGSLKNDPMVTLESSVNQVDSVEIAVTFTYSPPTLRREARVSKCQIHIKPVDSSLSEVVRCRMFPSGNSFMVVFRPSGQRTEKSFDLLALGGYCQGGCPFYSYDNGFVRIRFGNATRVPVKYVYWGPDPFL